MEDVQANLDKALDKHKEVFYDQFEMQRAEFEGHLLNLKKKLKTWGVDVMMIQEVNK